MFVLSILLLSINAQVVKLADTLDLGSSAVRCVGSSPILGILLNILTDHFFRDDKMVGFFISSLFQK